MGYGVSGPPHDGMDTSHGERVGRYGVASTALALLSDHRLGRLVDAAPVVGSGVGGARRCWMSLAYRFFLKRIPLIDLEREPGNVMSTANLFGVFTFCQYGVVLWAGPGFGAWRELAANAMTTNWVLTGQSEAFPLLYHWRVLPGAAPSTDEHADVERVVAYWAGSAAVRRRLHARRRHPALRTAAEHGVVLPVLQIPGSQHGAHQPEKPVVVDVLGQDRDRPGPSALRDELLRSTGHTWTLYTVEMIAHRPHSVERHHEANDGI